MNSNWMPGVAALMGLALAGPSSTEARDIYDRNSRSRYETNSGRIGFERGYEDGLKRGRGDGEDGDRYDVTGDGKYRDGDRGYRSSYGSRADYVHSYRSGFEQGYQDGYAPYVRGNRARAARGRGSVTRGGYYGTQGGRIYEIPRR